MDLSKTLEEVQLKDKEDEIKVKELLELSAKKYSLQKERDSLKVKLSTKKIELRRLQKEVIALSLEVPVLEKQEAIVKCTVRDLIKEVTEMSAETETIQENFWGIINSFVSDCNWFLAKQEPSMKNKNNNQTSSTSASTEQENKIRQLKVESELEAMHLYEKYQTTKMEELKLIRDLLGKDSFVI